MYVSLAQDVRDNVHKLPATVHFASPSWLDLSRGGASKYDRISEKPGGPEGIVVRGLKNLTVTFAQSHGYPGTIRSWKAPYTNVMYVNLKWLRNASTITAFTQVRLKYVCLVGGRFAMICGAPDAVCVARRRWWRVGAFTGTVGGIFRCGGRRCCWRRSRRRG